MRAVDTATRPSHQGRGIFRRMTLHALDDLRAEGVAFVFNTPNDSSRPGLPQDGLDAGRAPGRLVRLTVARRCGGWPGRGPRPTSGPSRRRRAGRRPRCSRRRASPSPARRGPPGRLSTHRTPAFLRWRYGFGPLAYRAVTLGDDVRNGVAIFRGGGGRPWSALCDVLAPAGEPGARRALVRSIGTQRAPTTS